jgi:hypothetical protein
MCLVRLRSPSPPTPRFRAHVLLRRRYEQFGCKWLSAAVTTTGQAAGPASALAFLLTLLTLLTLHPPND